MRNIIAAAVWQIIFFQTLVASAQQSLVIEGATLISSHLDEPPRSTSVLIEGERIVAIDAAANLPDADEATVVDGRGHWLVPGIIEVHSHSRAPSDLRRGLALGVTSALTIGASAVPEALEEQSHLPSTPSPRLRLIMGRFGEFLSRMGSQAVLPNPLTAEEARRDIAAMEKNGVRSVKVWLDDGTLWFEPERWFSAMPEAAFRGLVDAAHASNMPVYVHAWRLPLFRLAVDAGVDGVIHPVADQMVPAEIWRRMRELNLSWTTTMTGLLYFGDPAQYAGRVLSDPRLTAVLDSESQQRLERGRNSTEFPSDVTFPLMRQNSAKYLDTVRQNTIAARDAGVSIAVGTDAPVGIGTHLEMELLAEAGLTPPEIFDAATINGARAIGMEAQVGSIEPGKLADLVLLKADPLEDAKNWREVAMVIKGGQPFSPNELLPTAGD